MKARLLIGIFSVLLAAAGAAAQAQPPAEPDAGSIKSYGVEQRDEAVRKAKSALDEIDARIRRMETQAREQWHRMDETARQRHQEAQADLRQKRTEAAEWFGGLKHSSAAAWEDVKKGFARSYQNLREAFSQAPGRKSSKPGAAPPARSGEY